MWKKEEEDAGFVPPKKLKEELPKTPAGGVIAVQCSIAAIVLGAVFLLRLLAPPVFSGFATQYLDYLETGTPMTSTEQIYRFASAGLKSAQEAVAAFAASLENKPVAAGGQYEITHSEYLKTVTTGPYFLSDRAYVPVQGSVTSPFGYRTHPITGKDDFHTGIDLAVPKGTEIGVAFSGVVAETGYNKINGNYVMVVHSGTVATAYCHLDRIGVKVGDQLKRGETLGLVGETGMATGPHLHFELYINGVRVDPAPALGL